MNTTEVGDEFEQRVFKLFSDLLQRGCLPYHPGNSKIFAKKRYYSEARKNEIEVDISIESFIAGRDQYSSLLVIECKNYTSSIEVNRLESFHSTLEQIGASKGIFITSNAFQRGALNFAGAKKIGLARLLPEQELQWILDRSTSGKITNAHKQAVNIDLAEILTNDNFESPYFNFSGFYSGAFTHSIERLLRAMTHESHSVIGVFEPNINTVNLARRDVPFRSKQSIESFCNRIRQKLNIVGDETPIYEIFSRLEQKGTLKLEFHSSLGTARSGHEILARIVFNPTIVSVVKKANSPGITNHREKFSLAHELGHLLLKHCDYMKGEFYSVSDFKNTGRDIVPIENIARMEWQANYLASSLLLPRDRLRIVFRQIMKDLDLDMEKWNGALFVDNQSVNWRNYHRITDLLKEKFKVSRRVIEIALEELDLVIDRRKTPTSSTGLISDLLGSIVRARTFTK